MRAPTLLTAVAGLALPGLAAAAPILYQADLTTLNNSGATGQVMFTLDQEAETLTVHVQASGVEANQTHPQHIHGRFDSAGNVIDSTIPVPEDAFDDDGDGFVELLEGLPAYGPVIVSLTPFPTPSGTTINFMQTYDLTDSSIFGEGFDMDDLFPLDNRVFVLHGMSVEIGVGSATMGEVDGSGGFKAVLPIAAGEIRQVSDIPEPATLGLLGAGLLGMGILRRRRQG